MWPVAFFSILEAGLVAVPLPAETPLSAAAGIAARAGAPVAVVGNRTRGLAATNGLRCLPVEQLIQGGDSLTITPAEQLPELAVLAFTSGSTTQPRAVELTHANLLANLQAALQVRQAAPGDSFLSMLPPAHLFELMGACSARWLAALGLSTHLRCCRIAFWRP
jgi:long-subunit acyl-CoA synthetase (AMP-forming)